MLIHGGEVMTAMSPGGRLAALAAHAADTADPRWVAAVRREIRRAGGDVALSLLVACLESAVAARFGVYALLAAGEVTISHEAGFADREATIRFTTGSDRRGA